MRDGRMLWSVYIDVSSVSRPRPHFSSQSIVPVGFRFRHPMPRLAHTFSAHVYRTSRLPVPSSDASTVTLFRRTPIVPVGFCSAAPLTVTSAVHASGLHAARRLVLFLVKITGRNTLKYSHSYILVILLLVSTKDELGPAVLCNGPHPSGCGLCIVLLAPTSSGTSPIMMLLFFRSWIRHHCPQRPRIHVQIAKFHKLFLAPGFAAWADAGPQPYVDHYHHHLCSPWSPYIFSDFFSARF